MRLLRGLLMKKIEIGEIAPLDQVAKAAGVSRRTILRGATSAGAAVGIGGKMYVVRQRLRDVVGDGRYTPSVEKLAKPVRGKGTIRPDAILSKAEAARIIGSNPCTIFRLIRQFEIGTDVYGDRFIDAADLAELTTLYGRPHPFALDGGMAVAAGRLGAKKRWSK